MSDISYPVKNEGDTFSPAEANEIKTAVNSKQDKNKLVTTMASPASDTYPSTSAIAAYVDPDSQVKSRGTIDGTEDLDDADYAVPGFWMPEETWVEESMHESFPEGATKGCLIVYAHNDCTVQRFISFASPKEYVRTLSNDDAAVWSDWIYWLRNVDVDTDFSDPTDGKVPSTLAVEERINTDGTVQVKGELTGDEDLNTYKTTGLYIPTLEFDPADGSFPSQERGALTVYASEDYVLQNYTTYATHKVFIRGWDEEGGWTGWTLLNAGTPGSPSVTVDDGYGAAIAESGDDLNGVVAITRDEGDELGELTVVITFSSPLASAKSAQLTPHGAPADGYYITSLTTTALTFKVDGSFAVDATIHFHYSIN